MAQLRTKVFKSNVNNFSASLTQKEKLSLFKVWPENLKFAEILTFETFHNWFVCLHETAIFKDNTSFTLPFLLTRLSNCSKLKCTCVPSSWWPFGPRSRRQIVTTSLRFDSCRETVDCKWRPWAKWNSQIFQEVPHWFKDPPISI